MLAFLAPYSLKTGEAFVRADQVIHRKHKDSYVSPPRLATMVLTTQRVLFLPPKGHYASTTHRWPLAAFVGRATTPIPTEVLLDDVERLWKWYPEFSGPPMMQTGSNFWDFDLVIDNPPWRKRASLEEIRRHFEAVDYIWQRCAQETDAEVVTS